MNQPTLIIKISSLFLFIYVTQRIELKKLCIIYKLKTIILPSYLLENLFYVPDIFTNMTLRNAMAFQATSTLLYECQTKTRHLKKSKLHDF